MAVTDGVNVDVVSDTVVIELMELSEVDEDV